MHSEKQIEKRRVPQRAGGERRVRALLDAAAEEIVEMGYEAATMKAIARRAGASIGAIYQYFGDKEAVVQALRSEYSGEMDRLWADFTQTAGSLDVAEVGRQIIAILIRYTQARPAFIPLLNVPLRYERDPETRNRLREQFATLFLEKQSALTPQKAFQIANVSLEIVKAMRQLLAGSVLEERQGIGKEFELVLSSYLVARLTENNPTDKG